MTRPRNGVYIWVTWLSKMMAGEANCQWSAWFKAHHADYDRVPGDFQLAAWTAQHTQMLDEFSKEREKLGEIVYREGQNKINVPRKTNVTIAGTPDLVSLQPASGHYTVYDMKTGNPRQSDIIQVALYIMLLPHTKGIYRGKEFDGCVVYRSGRSDVPQRIIDEAFKKNVTHFLDILESASPPPRLPTHAGCAWCDLGTADCPDKVAAEAPPPDDGGPGFPL